MMNDIRLLQGFISKKRYVACNNLFLDLKEVCYVVIKGESLSFLAYRKMGERYGSDIDILLPPKTLNRVECLLEKNMFVSNNVSRIDKLLMRAYSHQLQPWSKEVAMIGGVTIDLNFDVFWGEYEGKRIDIEEFLSDTIEMEIYLMKNCY